MNYIKHYNSIMNRARGRQLDCYTESHHVVPRCMGGENGEVVDLTPEEHYVAHQLLAKIYPSNNKLAFALHAMTMRSEGQIRNNKMFGWVKRRVVQAITESNTGRVGYWKGKTRPAYKKGFTIEERAKISAY